MTEKKKKTILFIIIAFFILVALIYNSFQQEYLIDGKVTVGTVTEYQFNNNNWIGKYVYVINGKKYTGSWVGDFFKCSDGTKGCVGKKFPVRYSNLKPEISEINLQEYDNRQIAPPRIW